MEKRGARRGGSEEYSGGMDDGATVIAGTVLASERCMADSEGWMERIPQKSRWIRTRGNVITDTLARGKEKVVNPGGERIETRSNQSNSKNPYCDGSSAAAESEHKTFFFSA